jgi:hypothetical protein
MTGQVGDFAAVQPGPIAAPLFVRHVRDALNREFTGLLDDPSLVRLSPEHRDIAFCARALAALAVRHLTDCTSRDAAQSVIDGPGDNGIDAIAVGTRDGASELWLVQAKWSDKGRAVFTQADAAKLASGYQLLSSRHYGAFNDAMRALVPRVEAVTEHPGAKIHLVVALMGEQRPSHDLLQRLQPSDNATSDGFDITVLTARDFDRIARTPSPQPPVDLEVRFRDHLEVSEPYMSQYGIVSTRQVADWYEQHGNRLFERNLRNPLGQTPVNASITNSLLEDPSNFWYFNNGITLVCSALTSATLPAESGSTTVVLHDASIVNGAQTVSAISQAVRTDPKAGTASVLVRVISLAEGPGRLASDITRAVNLQNAVTERDFAALDPIQYRIRDDMLLNVDKSYAIKRGELLPAPESGSSLDEAALALACAHSNIEHCARISADPASLWREGESATYSALFSRFPPDGVQVWRAVQVRRAVQAALSEAVESRASKMALVAQYAGLVVNNLVFRHLAADLFDSESEETWHEQVLLRVSGVTTQVLLGLTGHAVMLFGSGWNPKATFEDAGRCKALARAVLADLSSGAPPPSVPADYARESERRRVRQPGTMTILREHANIPDGTILTFDATASRERNALADWLAADSRRAQAAWVADVEPVGHCLRWAVDGQVYSASGLVMKIWEAAGWEARPLAVQGALRWRLPAGETLHALARRLMPTDSVSS